MKPARSAIVNVLFLLLLPLLGLGQAHAEGYDDVNQFVAKREFAQALAKVDSMLVSQPVNPQLRFIKGVLQTQLGRPDAAQQIYTELIQDYPELPEPYNNLAVLLAAQGRFEPARAALEMAIRANPSYATAHENLGDVYVHLAKQSYERARTDPSQTGLDRKLKLSSELLSNALKTSP